jgi:large subunit ribosomal protein L13
MMSENPEKAMNLAVRGMLPGNTLGRKALTRLRLSAVETHEHSAQQPQEWAM